MTKPLQEIIIETQQTIRMADTRMKDEKSAPYIDQVSCRCEKQVNTSSLPSEVH